MNANKRPLFTVDAAHKYLTKNGLDISKSTLYRRIAQGDIDVIRPFHNSRNIKIERATLEFMLTPR